MGIVDEAVEDGVGKSGIGEGLVPVLDGQLGGDGRGAAFIAVVEYLQEVAQSGVVDGHEAVVDLRREGQGRRDQERLVEGGCRRPERWRGRREAG